MTPVGAKKIVLLGLMTKMPVPGNIWLVAQYLIGFQRLGFDVYYVEAHGITPAKFFDHANDDGTMKAAEFIASVMKRFDLSDRWAYHSVFEGRYFGMSAEQLRALYQSADLIINLHGGTVPLPEHSATGRLVYLETDPVQLQIELHNRDQVAIDFLSPHVAFFSWGLNYGNPDCRVPQDPRFDFKPTCPPVLIDYWAPYGSGAGTYFTTVGNWRQLGSVVFEGETYYWSKDREFTKLLDLPRRAGERFELALSSTSYRPEDLRILEDNGWKVRDSMAFATDLDAYREYVANSRGEFTVAKDQNVRLRSGWFSERSATYLAAGRPVVTQDTGFGSVLPTGEGLFSFSTVEEAAAAIAAIDADYERHRRAAGEIARQHFSHDVVLERLLDDIGVGRQRHGRQERAASLPGDLVLVPRSRRPVELPDETVATALARRIPSVSAGAAAPDAGTRPLVSVLIVTFNNLVYNKLCLEALLTNTAGVEYEVVVVDNASTDGTVSYLNELAGVHRRVRILFNATNRGFAAANNAGAALATGDVLVLLNNDTIVPPGWLSRLVRHLDDPSIGMVGPVTNRICNEAQVDASYVTYSEMLRVAEERTRAHAGEYFDIRMLAMFCTAMKRAVFDQVGPIDERYEVGMLEDEDYAIRVRNAGYRVVCAEDVFVHHFGEASFGALVASGEFAALYDRNRRRFEEKWGIRWEPYRHRVSDGYRQMVERMQSVVCDAVPADAIVLVVSRGDDELLKLAVRSACHFPRTDDGVYTGFNPADSHGAIRALEAERRNGAAFLVVPSTALWWLDYYTGFRQHLERQYPLLVRQQNTCVIFDLLGAHSHGLNGATSGAQRAGVEDGAR